MTLQERMIQAYLRQAALPPGEKEKLKLFLILLDETYKEEGERIATATAFSCGVTEDEGTIPQTPAAPAPFTQGSHAGDEGSEKPKPVDPLVEKAASEAPAERSSGKAPGEEGEKTKVPDPLAEPLLKALEKEGLSLEEAAAGKYIGVRASVLQKVLDGESIRKDSREKISRWVQGVGIAVTDGI